jgi:hypothetical protein
VETSQSSSLEKSKRRGLGLRKTPNKADKYKWSSTIAMLRKDILECM